MFYKHFAYNSLKHDIIYHKAKYSRYTNLQKKLIYQEYWWKTNLKEISNKYNVSVSSIYKIVKDYNSRYIDSNISNREIKTDARLSLEEKILIQNFIKPPQIPVTIQSINDEVNKVFEFKWRKREIKLFLKNSLNYSYKKGSATTIKGASDKTKYCKSIFSSRALREITKNKLLINIDECSF